MSAKTRRYASVEGLRYDAHDQIGISWCTPTRSKRSRPLGGHHHHFPQKQTHFLTTKLREEQRPKSQYPLSIHDFLFAFVLCHRSGRGAFLSVGKKLNRSDRLLLCELNRKDRDTTCFFFLGKQLTISFAYFIK
ncbi:hypothetical protein ABEB36_011868 [Hypothenemus hampei]|uniref:Uncharacterized protein n=1 Tax=Hypothenemus hampei TaxID=57062 RepID=A0ABD1E9A2_HYPHA